MDTEGDDKASEQRSATRQRVLKSAQVVYNNGNSTLDCIIEDLSLTGARIQLPYVVTLPQAFSIRFQDGHICPVELGWARSNRAGVRFTTSGMRDQPPAKNNGTTKTVFIERLAHIESQIADLRKELKLYLSE